MREWDEESLSKFVTDAYTGTYPCTLQPNSFSATYTAKLDTSFKTKKIHIATTAG